MVSWVRLEQTSYVFLFFFSFGTAHETDTVQLWEQFGMILKFYWSAVGLKEARDPWRKKNLSKLLSSLLAPYVVFRPPASLHLKQFALATEETGQVLGRGGE